MGPWYDQEKSKISDHMPRLFLKVTNSRTDFLTLLASRPHKLTAFYKHGDRRTSKSDDYLFDLRIPQLALKAV